MSGVLGICSGMLNLRNANCKVDVAKCEETGTTRDFMLLGKAPALAT